ncbi:hypothetical protein [Pseudoxanthomonas sp. z9]|uniref:hypothetical protein n=1 Tax=Pseudoxanthomonas sp. z9 TaxID=2584942 RepID=UPI001144DD3B|nr:hypothetical protein [Pseudoxanthomonas sp. z9]
MAESTGSFSLAAMERRLMAIPDGPATVLNTPGWVWWLNVLGGVGVVVGLASSVLVQFIRPQVWMVYLAQAGTFTAIAGWAPFILRSLWVILRSVRNWKGEQAAQLDHDVGHFRELTDWLVTFPKGQLVEYRRMTSLWRQQLDTKVGLLSGGFSRLGFLPVAAALFLLLMNRESLLAIPGWLAMLGAFVVLLYLISTSGALMKIRVDLYDTLLANAIERKGGRHD